MLRHCFRFMAWAAMFGLAAWLPDSLAADETDFFEARIRPVLVATCLECHGGKETASGLQVNSRESLLAGGERGPAVVPGDANGSLLIQAIRRSHEDLAMPPAKSLAPEVVADFESWINAGAPWTEALAITRANDIGAQAHWSFQPLARPRVPAPQSVWPTSPIDAFVLAKLEDGGLVPNPPADKSTLLRRLCLDLTGLPPTNEQLRAFAADQSPDATEKLVDRLLSSPHYGERLGRYWLDIVRYADTAGNPPDFPVPQAYRYRNYVIDAFNADVPFDQFVREQIAGDLLEATSEQQRQQQIIATGYLAIGRRYFGTKNGPDHLEVEDLIQNFGTAFLGLSLGCCRCHDHKFDPVSQQEYYALYGLFSSTRFPQPGSEGKSQQENFVALSDGSDAYSVADTNGVNARIQQGGDPSSLGDEVPRGFIKVLGGQQLPPSAQGSGRSMLADWLTDSARNPLLARVIVNRIWQHHFGTGLVDTPNDFGLRGSAPSHPELLDYLACELIDSGWSIKSLQRKIVLSQTYQLSCADHQPNAAVDPTNRWLWRHARRRLDAESIRDALLAVSGELDRSAGHAHPFPAQHERNYSQHAPFVAVYETNRRSVYLMQQRLKRHPFLSLFDGADPNVSTGLRPATTTPIQSLFWINDPFVHTQADRFAERLLRECVTNEQRVQQAFQWLYARPASGDELQTCLGYLADYAARCRAVNMPPPDVEHSVWCSLARVLFASNEFIYID